MTQKAIYRHYLETSDGVIRPMLSLTKMSEAERDALIDSAREVMKREIKSAIWGLAPIFGKDQVLALVMQVMAEDFDPDGPQTPLPGDEDEEGGQ